MRKFAAILLILLMVIPAIPRGAAAAGGTGSPVVDSVVFTLSYMPEDGVTKPVVTGDEEHYRVDAVYWLGSEFSGGKFVAGRTYTLSVRCIAFGGYLFAGEEDLFISASGVSPKSVTYSKQDGFDVIEADFDFYIHGKKEIGCVSASLGMSHIPRAGELGDVVMMNDFDIGTDIRYVSRYVPYDGDCLGAWKDEYGESCKDGARFKYGTVYYIDLWLKINDTGNYKFSEKTSFVLNNYGKYVSEVTLIDSFKIKVRLKIRAEFSSAGDTPVNRVKCYCFEDLKGALEDQDIIYVELMDVPDPGIRDNIPLANGSADDNYYCILQMGTKKLTVTGDSYFKYEETISGHPKPVSLICVTGTVTVDGDGSIYYSAPAVNTANAVFANRGKLTISGNVTVSSGCPVIKSGCVTRAVYQNYSGATLTVNGGSYRILKTKNKNANHAALDVRAGRATINAGRFEFYGSDTPEDVYGLAITSGATVSVKAGVFTGILLPAGKTIGDYIPQIAICTVGGVEVPRSANEQLKSGTVAVCGMIDSVSVYVNEPQAGKAPDFTGASVTEGVNVGNVSWYDTTSGRYLSESDTFTVGHVYTATVRVMADECHRFKTTGSGGFGITAKLNYQTVTPKKVNGYTAAEAYDASLTFAACPNTIYDIDVTVTPPLAGLRVNETRVTFDSSAYGLFPTDPVTWYDMTDGGRIMVDAEKFVEGRSYKVSIWVKAAKGYYFQTTPQFEPGIAATLNGEIVTPKKAYEQSPDEVVDLTYDFGAYLTTVNTAHVHGYEKPVPGGYPSFSIASDYPDLYTVDQITWSGSSVMKPGDKFERSKTYTLWFRISMNKLNGESLHYFSPDIGLFIDGDMIESSNYTVYSEAVVVSMSFRTSDGSSVPGDGDVDNDGEVTMKDVLIMRRYIAGLDTLTDSQIARGDMDGDGDITMKDVLRARRIIAGLD